jgi:parallel beta-helix repeat protein
MARQGKASMQFISPAIKIAVAAFAVLLATATVTLADVLDVREAEGMALAAGASATTTHAVLNANGERATWVDGGAAAGTSVSATARHNGSGNSRVGMTLYVNGVSKGSVFWAKRVTANAERTWTGLNLSDSDDLEFRAVEVGNSEAVLFDRARVEGTPPPPPPPPECADGQFDAEYRNEVRGFTTTPVIDRCESAPLEHVWGTSSPGAGVTQDNFTSRYVGRFEFAQAGDYRFDVTTNDGVRLYVDDVLVMDQWFDHLGTHQATKNLTSGMHTLRIEHYEGINTAQLSVEWTFVEPPPPPPPPPPDCSTSLQSLINNAAAGSTLTLGNCTYRESVTVNKPLTLDGQGVASLRGSDVWSGLWAASGGNWVSSQSVPTLHTETRDICLSGSDQRCKLPEQVFVDGAAQYQRATGSDPGPGQFALNGSRNIVLGSDPAGKTVEVTTRQSIANAGANNVTLKGLDMRHSANQFQTGAVENDGFSNFTLQDSTVAYGHGENVFLRDAPGLKILNSSLTHGGCLGLGAPHVGLEMRGGELAHNNTEEFSRGNEAGGAKITDFGAAGDSRTILFDSVDVHDNNGIGIWIDIDVKNTTITNNRVYNNHDFGIFFEVSDGAEIAHNVVFNNGTDSSGYVWGAQIAIGNSRNANVHDNIVAWGADGIAVMSHNRTDWPAYNNVTGVKVHHNTILRHKSGFEVLALGWMQTFNGVLYSSASANEGYDNAYWFPNAEPSGDRYHLSSAHSTLSGFNATPGEERGRYLTTAEKDAIVAAHNLPGSLPSN